MISAVEQIYSAFLRFHVRMDNSACVTDLWAWKERFTGYCAHAERINPFSWAKEYTLKGLHAELCI